MPRTPRNPHTRETLLQKGLELVLRQGYHGTGISEIVQAADVPKGSFYNHFESKEAFVAELIERYGANLREALNGLLLGAPSDDALAALTLAYEMVAQLQESSELEGCLIANLAAEVGSAEGLCAEAVRTQMTAWSEDITALLLRGQTEGTVRTDHSAADLAEFFWDAWEGALLRAKTEHSPAALERAVRMLRSFFRPTT